MRTTGAAFCRHRAVFPALLPAVALVVGAAAGIACVIPWHWLLCVLPAVVAVAFAAWHLRHARLTLAGCVFAFGIAGFILGSDARARALDTPLRAEDLASSRTPTAARLLLTEDASVA